MNKPDEAAGDELTRAYRRASDADAGSPAAATRAAILAEARAAALRRTPAANDSRYVWRAAAGIAVLGVAVILWRQTHHELTAELVVTAPEATAVATGPPLAAEPPVAAPQTGAGAVAEQRAADRPDVNHAPAQASSKDETEAPLKSAPTRAREEASGASAVTSEAPQTSVQLARATADIVAPIPAAAAGAGTGALREDAIDYQLLLQREFPAVWNGSEPTTTVWVVMDARGKVLRKGSLAPGATVTADQPFEVRNAWEMVNVKTASGSSLQLAVTMVK